MIRPVYEQIVTQVIFAVATGVLDPGTMIPSVRELGQRLLVHPNTVAKAFGELERQGVILPVRGKGMEVTAPAPVLCRARRLYTGRIIERSIDEIDCLGTMVYQVGGDTTAVIEGLLGRVKGVEVRFRDQRTPLRVLRADPAMTNAAELIEALLYRMRQQRELDTEVVNWVGKQLVRRVWWQGETPGKPPGKVLKLVLALLIFFALAFGGVCGAVWLRVQDQYEGGKLPPHEIDLRTLIEHGPGANRHVTITGYQPGGYVKESEGKLWTQVWVALFPAGARPEEFREIKVVVGSRRIPGEAVLRQWLSLGPITGICSAAPRTTWGTALGPLLSQANDGSTLTAAWSIAEVRELPSAAEVTGTWAGAVGGFAAVLILAALVFLIAREQRFGDA